MSSHAAAIVVGVKVRDNRDCLPLSTATPTVLILRHGAKQLACSVQLLPHGLQLHLALNSDTPYCSRIFQTQNELLAWAEEERIQNLAESWS